VFNQSSPLNNINLFMSDPILRTSHFILECHRNHVMKYGEITGSIKSASHATLAERNKPTLKQFDSYGRRVDVIDYHESYHFLMKQGLESGVAGYGYTSKQIGSHIARASMLFMENQLEPGHCCPVVMTTAAVGPLRKWGMNTLADKLIFHGYDSRDIPLEEKKAITAGMSMTEKQGGSDVRANTTLAVPLNANKVGNGEAYSLRGHKVILLCKKANVSHFFSLYLVP
jgi:putative acyl-CoA dehydrogenase